MKSDWEHLTPGSMLGLCCSVLAAVETVFHGLTVFDE